MKQEVILKFNIWKQIIVILLGTFIISALFWLISLYIDIGDVEIYLGLFLASSVVAAIATMWHSGRVCHRFGLHSQGISINHELFDWQNINEARLTQRGLELPTLILYLANEQKVAYLVQLRETQYAVLLATLKAELGDKLKVSARARKANYPHINTNIYHDPN